jgi:hypothetical protein
MSRAVAESVRGRCKAVAVSDAYTLAPWADALVSNDAMWWKVHAAAVDTFPGRKFAGCRVPEIEALPVSPVFGLGSNSGLQGMRVAVLLGATRILLLGFDMRGDHFFGKHPAPLRNTTTIRYQILRKQFDRWRGCPVINCTPGSALKQFPFMTFEEAMAC